MKTKLIIITSLIFSSFSSFAIHIYSITNTVNMGGGCVIYQTLFYDDMGTTTTTADDRYMGMDAILECGHNPMVPEDLNDINLDEDGNYYIPAGVKMIPYDEYQDRRKKKDAIQNDYFKQQGLIQQPNPNQIEVIKPGGQ